MAKKKKAAKKKSVETLTHPDDKRTNIPTAELESVVSADDRAPKSLKYPRNPDLDPQLVWRGKDEQDWSDLVVNAPPLYIQEKVHPKVLIDDLLKQTQQEESKGQQVQLDLFGDFNGLPDEARSTEFYQHEANWTNRMILGDSLQVMASLAEREGLRGKVQCIYIDPPYGIKFNSNFQWSTTSRDVKDGKSDHITREPEQVKAFRDTWRDGIHSYLTYLRDRLTVARDLLSESGSIFVQISDDNVHRVRSLLDDVFGEDNFISLVPFSKTSGTTSTYLPTVCDFLLWYGKDRSKTKYRKVLYEADPIPNPKERYVCVETPAGEIIDLSVAQKTGETPRPKGRILRLRPTDSQAATDDSKNPVDFNGRDYFPPRGRHWSVTSGGMATVVRSGYVVAVGNTLTWKYYREPNFVQTTNDWLDIKISGFGAAKQYIVETLPLVVQRCVLMTTDPGDLVLDPTCGSGTTAYVSEQWGRRWITLDTSRVALALARSRIMGARFPFYFLADSKEGVAKEAEVTRNPVPEKPVSGNIRHGFVYERFTHVKLSSIARNAEIDVIWEQFREKLEPLREDLNKALKQKWEEWEIPREAGERWEADACVLHSRVTHRRTELERTIQILDSLDLSEHSEKIRKAAEDEVTTDLKTLNRLVKGKYTFQTLPDEPRDPWPDEAKKLHADWWKLRIERQQEIDASIAAKADFEYLYDRPYEDKSKVRVAGPFTVESLSPHRTLGVDADDELIDPAAAQSVAERKLDYGHGVDDFVSVILENLKTSGVQQSAKEDKISFTSINGWPGEYICAKAEYVEGANDESGDEKTAGIFIGPEFGTVSRQDLVRSVRECADAGFDVLIACAFNYGAHAEDFKKLGNVPVLKARMNADLHMADDLKNTGKGNLFVIFGEPDIEIRDSKAIGHLGDIEVQIHGVDVFKPNTGEVVSDSTDGIACWFIDTDYNEESFFVRHAYFLGADDPYKSLKTTLKSEINEEAWASLNSDTSRPFPRPKSGCIAVKVINHLGDEVMKVFRVE